MNRMSANSRVFEIGTHRWVFRAAIAASVLIVFCLGLVIARNMWHPNDETGQAGTKPASTESVVAESLVDLGREKTIRAQPETGKNDASIESPQAAMTSAKADSDPPHDAQKLTQSQSSSATAKRPDQGPAPKEVRDESQAKPPAATENRPAQQEVSKEQRERLQEIARIKAILDSAEEANRRGQFLEAATRWGQAALLHSRYLAEVESPEQVLKKFLDALSRYQAEVERALHEASLKKAEGRRINAAAPEGKR
jgi:hypothetical protein